MWIDLVMSAFKNFRIRGRDKKIREYIKDLCEQIVRVAQPQKIILFGSYAYGNPTEDSDIDLLSESAEEI
jgi:predicted nucleotidyltransferase